ATGSASEQVFHSNEPSLIVDSPGPIPFPLANPKLHVATTCHDDDPAGCATATTRILVAGQQVASGTGNLAIDLSLEAFEGTHPKLLIMATDSDGQSTAISYVPYVDSSPDLSPAATVPGRIVAADDNQILYVANELMNSGADLGVVVRDRKTLDDTVVMSIKQPVDFAKQYTVDAGWLAPSGAAFFAIKHNDFTAIDYWLWRAGSLTYIVNAFNPAR